MAKWDLSDLEQQIRDLQRDTATLQGFYDAALRLLRERDEEIARLRDESDTLRAVNAEQARIIGEKNAHMAFLEDQLRRAQERMRVARSGE